MKIEAQKRSGRGALPREARPGKWDISSQTYWRAAGLLVLAYLALWAANIHNVYGFLGDDRTYYFRGAPVTQEAFTYYNAYHAYWLLVSYLPLRAGLRLPSHPLPGIPDTGQFRFLLVYSIVMTAGILAIWARGALAFVERRVTALVALALLVVSPSFVLWTPEPESRLCGFPFMVAAILIFFRLNELTDSRAPRVAAMSFLAGTVIWFGQSVNYTLLYLVAPFSVIFWVVWMWRLRFGAAAWAGSAAFGAGLLWLQRELSVKVRGVKAAETAESLLRARSRPDRTDTDSGGWTIAPF